MILTGSQDELWAALQTVELANALQDCEHIDGRMFPYQMAALYRLAQPYDGGRILEIGCYRGRSALMMALAAPHAKIVTMSPIREHVDAALVNTRKHNITVLQGYSWDYLRRDAHAWNMIFVDGDHRQVARDLPWFNRLEIGGLMLFHDYTREHSTHKHRGFPEVCAAVDGLSKQLGRAPDVKIIDAYNIGMAGFYRKEKEQWRDPKPRS